MVYHNLTIIVNGRFFGFHIHEGTSCSGNLIDEFANAKSHLNTTDCPHPFHIGDLPPLFENNGYSYMSVLINKFIHDSPDDFISQPSRKFWKQNCMW